MKLARTGSLALLTTIALAACNDANGPSEADLAVNEAVAAVAQLSFKIHSKWIQMIH